MIRTGRFEWPLVVLFLVLAAISRSPALIVLAAGGLALGGLVWLTSRLALVALDATVEVTSDRIVAGEGIVATVRIANRKPMPMPWLDLRLFLPDGIDPAELPPGVPHEWVTVMKEAIRTLAPQFSTRRMLKEYAAWWRGRMA